MHSAPGPVLAAAPFPKGPTNRQRAQRYDELIERAQAKADRATDLAARRRYLNLISRLQRRALRELARQH